MRLVSALLCVAALVACATPAPAQEETPGAMDLQIETGRWSVMNDRIRDFATDENRPAPTGLDYDDPSNIARRLRIAVWDYNALAAQLCEEGRHTAITCQRAYAPAWLAEPSTGPVPLAELKTRSDAVGELVMPLWDALCEEAREGVPMEDQIAVCPME